MNNGHVTAGEADKTMIGIPTQPHTPSVSPVPESHSPPKSPSSTLSMEQILASIEKVDRDIVDMDRVIKKVNSELAVSFGEIIS